MQEKSLRKSGDVAELFLMLQQHMSSTFELDFPFYILLAYRVHYRWNSYYRCDEVKSFISDCQHNLETMRKEYIATQVLSFIGRYVAIN